MKKIKLVILLIVAFTANLYCQTETDKKNTVGLHIAPNYWPVVHSFEHSISLGIDYSRRLSSRWSILGGIEEIGFISKNKVKYTSWEEEDGLHASVTSKPRKIPGIDAGILTIPVQLKYHFNNHVYLNTGPSLDVSHSQYNTEVGLGWRFGAGYEYEFNNGLSLYLNPYLKWSSMLREFGNEASYIVFGASLGVGYKF